MSGRRLGSVRREDRDRGSVMLLVVGLVAVALGAFVVLTDASAAFLQRQQLLALVDAAALAGAQSIDLDAYYAEGATQATRLDPDAVVRRVRGHLTRAGASDIPGFALDHVGSDRREVAVRASAPARLPFLGSILPVTLTVESHAVLAYAP